ncbi:DUF413 domain-containing protein [Pseudaeromonas sp. ZJS20]|uniref:DUF413 domain-containing protein n=1 Tax=Pseudaeromonas aegiceratis TaxID=3153928 RepID=UPI00390CD3EE
MSFETDKRFNDLQHFPRGIRRSGEFTVAEADLLERHGHAMLSLYQGKTQPQDELETSFLEKVQQGDASGHSFAKVWLKYLKVIGPRRVHRLCTASGSGGDDGASFESVDESLE